MLSPDFAPIAVALLVALCTVALVLTLLYSRVAGRSPAATRLEAIKSASTSFEEANVTSVEGRRKKKVESTLREMDEKQKAKKHAKPSLMTRIRQAGLGWSKRTYYLTCVITGCVSVIVSLLGFRISLLPSFGFGLAGGLLLPHLFVNSKRKRRFKAFSSEFPNAVDVIVRGVKAGLPLVDCLKLIAAEAQEPVRSEFRQVVEDQTLGIPMDEAVQRMAERIPLSEANFFSIVLTIQSKTGGSLAEALGNLSKVLRERTKMQAKIKAMSSEAKASGGIIGSLPIIVGLLVYLTTPKYIALLFTTITGNLVLVGCALWMGIGIMVMRKMINFDF